MLKLSVNLRAPILLLAILLLQACSLLTPKPEVVDSQAQQLGPLREGLTEEFSAALELLSEQDFEQAKQALLVVTEKYPQFPGPWVNLGISQLNMKEYEDSLLSLNKAIEIKADFCAAHSVAGIVQRELGQFKEARSSYETAIQCDPQDINSIYNLGVLLDLYLHDEAAALDHYQQYMARLGEQQDETVQSWIVDLKRRVKVDTPQPVVEPAEAASEESSEQQVAEESL